MYAASTTRLILFLFSRFTGELYYAIRVYNGSTEGRDSRCQRRQSDPLRAAWPDLGHAGSAKLIITPHNTAEIQPLLTSTFLDIILILAA